MSLPYGHQIMVQVIVYMDLGTISRLSIDYKKTTAEVFKM